MAFSAGYTLRGWQNDTGPPFVGATALGQMDAGIASGQHYTCLDADLTSASAVTYAGALAFATDTGCAYLSIGGQWRRIATPAVGFKAWQVTGPYNVTDGTQLTLDTKDDPGGVYSTSTGKFTAPYPGLYSMTAQYGIDGSPGALDTYFSVRLYKNGTGGSLYEGQRFPNRGYKLVVSATQSVRLAAGDTLQAHVSVGAAIPSSPCLLGETYTWMAVSYVRP